MRCEKGGGDGDRRGGQRMAHPDDLHANGLRLPADGRRGVEGRQQRGVVGSNTEAT